MPRDNEIDQALDNLSAIKQGQKPTKSEGKQDSEQKGPLEVAKDEVDRLYEEHDLDETLDRSNIHVGVARWDGRNGVCKPNTRLTEHHFGKRMSSQPTEHGAYAVVINEKIFEQGNTDDFIDTVRHEVAHAITRVKYGPNQKHNQNWKATASKLGADPSSTHHKRDREDEYNYYIICPSCGTEFGKKKRSNTIQRPFLYKCVECGEHGLSSYEAGDEPPEEGSVVAINSIPWDDKSDWYNHGAPKSLNE